MARLGAILVLVVATLGSTVLAVMDWRGSSLYIGSSSLYFHGTLLEYYRGRLALAAYSRSGFVNVEDWNAPPPWTPVFMHHAEPVDWWTWQCWRWAILVPSWLPPLLFAAASVLVARFGSARGGGNLCGRCGYDRRGLREGACCPECGQAP